jgi:cystathionine gamma-synthase
MLCVWTHAACLAHPLLQSYWSFGPEKRAEIGIKENLIRFSVGIENVEDLWEDLQQALAGV